jgi:hypothetical protein
MVEDNLAGGGWTPLPTRAISRRRSFRPRIILLDKYLVRQIPSQFSYQPIVSGTVDGTRCHREKLAAKMAEYQQKYATPPFLK